MQSFLSKIAFKRAKKSMVEQVRIAWLSNHRVYR